MATFLLSIIPLTCRRARHVPQTLPQIGIGGTIARPPEWSRYSSRSLPSATTHRSAPVDDRSGAGGLLPGEIPRILTICAHCEPSPAVPSPLCRLPLVILQQAAQSFSTPHCSRVPSCLRLQRKQDAIAFALMVPLFMVMQQILLQGSPQRSLSMANCYFTNVHRQNSERFQNE